jgi:hypothetical protein
MIKFLLGSWADCTARQAIPRSEREALVSSGTNTAREGERIDESLCAVAAVNNTAGSSMDVCKSKAIADF